MTKQIEALKMAIEAIEYQESLDPFESSTTEWNHSWKELHKALIICKEALAEAEKQEPVAWLSTNSKANEIIKTHPATWQSLSDDEIANCTLDKLLDEYDLKFARSIEQALKDKNNV